MLYWHAISARRCGKDTAMRGPYGIIGILVALILLVVLLRLLGVI